jgi:hypothetical protein
MRPIDYFEDHVEKGHCPWADRDLTQTSLKLGYVCRRNYEAGARGNEGCTAEDWKRCPLMAHQVLPPFRVAVKEAEMVAT